MKQVTLGLGFEFEQTGKQFAIEVPPGVREQGLAVQSPLSEAEVGWLVHQASTPTRGTFL